MGRSCEGSRSRCLILLVVITKTISLLEYARAQEVPCSVAHYVNANERRVFVFQRAGLMEDMLCVFTFQTDADVSIGIAVTRFDFGEIQDNNCSCGTIRIIDVTPSGDQLLANTCSRQRDPEVSGPIAAVRARNNVVVVTLSTQGCPGPNLCLEVGNLDDSLFQNFTTSGYTESTSVYARSSEETSEGYISTTTTITASEKTASTEPSDQSITGSENTQIAETTVINEETSEGIDTTTVEELSSTGFSDQWSTGSGSTSPADIGPTTNVYEETTQSSVFTTDEDVSSTTSSDRLVHSESTSAENTEGSSAVTEEFPQHEDVSSTTSSERLVHSESSSVENTEGSSAVTEETSVGLGTTGNSPTGSSDLAFPHAGYATPDVVERTTPEYYTHSRTEETTMAITEETTNVRGFSKSTTDSDMKRITSPRRRRPGTRSSIGPKTTTEETETTTKKKSWWWPFG